MNLRILGLKGKIDSVSDTLNQINSIKKDSEIIQLLNADAVAGRRHIEHGVNQAFLAFERGENLANDLSVEICLRCSAQRQISKAFDLLGLKEGPMNLCAILIDCEDYTSQMSSLFDLDESVLTPDADILKEIYGISDDELEIMDVEDILIDRISKLIVDY
ncbi:KEOPS complex subunit Cgi121 [Methanobrevibacter sp.]|uniref:KEOPS complex subunit Cgi121 n=1 Tax=Methanobrevibacter sp. TaxID=66852 RepID=UPI00388F573A